MWGDPGSQGTWLLDPKPPQPSFWPPALVSSGGTQLKVGLGLQGGKGWQGQGDGQWLGLALAQQPAWRESPRVRTHTHTGLPHPGLTVEANHTGQAETPRSILSTNSDLQSILSREGLATLGRL